MEGIEALAKLLKERNRLDEQISKLIGRPATQGHIGEFIASNVFDIKLEGKANNKGFDGHFKSEKTVDVKFYGKQEGTLAIKENTLPDYFLVLTGPRSPAISSRGHSRPCVIDRVYLFESKTLVEQVRTRNVKISSATSVTNEQWEAAETYPIERNKELNITKVQQALLSMFCPEKPTA
jgi:hypothetical protein